MPKLSREQRKAERARARSRALRVVAVATTAVALLAVTLPSGSETAQAAPEQPVAAEVASSRLPSDPPASGVCTRQTESEKETEEDPMVAQRQYLDLLKRLDDERALDIRIQDYYKRRVLSIQDILKL